MNEIKPILVAQCPLFTRSGYGNHSLDLVKSLIRYDKFNVKIVPMRWGSCPLLPSDNKDLLELQKYVLTQKLTEPPEVFFQVSIPNESQPIGKYNIIMTAGIETTISRAEWIEGMNKMHLCMVPSNHARDVFQRSTFTKQNPNGSKEEIKCKVPIEVVFEGCDTNVFKKSSDTLVSVNEKLDSLPENFLFLFVGHWLQGDIGHDRKDVGMLVKIFCETFKGQKNMPALVLKTSGATFSVIDKYEILKKIDGIRKTISGEVPNVYLLHGELTDEEMNSLYNHKKVKVHASFTKGEGFGRPLLEASLSGKPVIASDWSGHKDFLNKEYAIMLPGEVKQVHPSAVNDFIIKESGWFTVNYSNASNVFKDVFDNYGKYLPNAEKLRKENESKFSMTEMDRVLWEILDKNVPKFEKRVELVLPKLPKLKKKE